MSNHIERMEQELKELIERRNKGLKAIENNKIYDTVAKKMLEIQLKVMLEYINILKERIDYAKERVKAKAEYEDVCMMFITSRLENNKDETIDDFVSWFTLDYLFLSEIQIKKLFKYINNYMNSLDTKTEWDKIEKLQALIQSLDDFEETTEGE